MEKPSAAPGLNVLLIHISPWHPLWIFLSDERVLFPSGRCPQKLACIAAALSFAVALSIFAVIYAPGSTKVDGVCSVSNWGQNERDQRGREQRVGPGRRSSVPLHLVADISVRPAWCKPSRICAT